MKITALIENTTTNKELKPQHGLSLHIETQKNKLLVDTGCDGLFLENANKLGIDISAVDMLVITHGHFDHGGGLKAFLKANNTAKIYLQDKAFNRHFIKVLGLIKVDIGLDDELKCHPQVVLIKGDCHINDEIMLIANPPEKKLLPQFNKTLWASNGKNSAPDEFEHEQSILITDNKTVLISGCSHRGIANIISYAETKVRKPIDVCIGGFHLYNPATKATENIDTIKSLAAKLQAYETKFYTCHCTGMKAFKIMKAKMQENIDYLMTGKTITLS